MATNKKTIEDAVCLVKSIQDNLVAVNRFTQAVQLANVAGTLKLSADFTDSLGSAGADAAAAIGRMVADFERFKPGGTDGREET